MAVNCQGTSLKSSCSPRRASVNTHSRWCRPSNILSVSYTDSWKPRAIISRSFPRLGIKFSTKSIARLPMLNVDTIIRKDTVFFPSSLSAGSLFEIARRWNKESRTEGPKYGLWFRSRCDKFRSDSNDDVIVFEEDNFPFRVSLSVDWAIRMSFLWSIWRQIDDIGQHILVVHVTKQLGWISPLRAKSIPEIHQFNSLKVIILLSTIPIPQ